jgi:hypothetical protein
MSVAHVLKTAGDLHAFACLGQGGHAARAAISMRHNNFVTSSVLSCKAKVRAIFVMNCKSMIIVVLTMVVRYVPM